MKPLASPVVRARRRLSTWCAHRAPALGGVAAVLLYLAGYSTMAGPLG